MKFAIISLGCPKNLTDSEIIIGLLKENNFEIANEDIADFIIVNTCGFISSAERESREVIEDVISKNKKVIICGCLVQKHKEKIKEIFPSAVAYIGPDRIYEICNVIKSTYTKKVHISKVPKFLYKKTPRIILTPKHTAYLKIGEGCNHRCSFCIVPKLRGKYTSKPIEFILDEAKKLAEHNTKEIILVAQDTTSWGIDIYGKRKLSYLLKQLVKIDEIFWIRVLYTYPTYITKDVIDTIMEEKKICNYIDIPLQHVSDNVLKRMNRFHTKEKAINVLKYIREKDKKFCLRTTFLLGHPGEGESDFNELLFYVKDIRFDKLGAFIYSNENLAQSSCQAHKVDRRVAEKRYKKLMQLQMDISFSRNKEFIGDILEVLIEKENKKFFIGRSFRDAPEIDGVVFVKKERDIKIGSFVKVKIVKAHTYDLEGVVI